MLFDENGRVIEQLKNYVVKIMEHHPEYPAPEEIADPGERDGQLLASALQKHCAAFGLTAPKIAAAHLRGLQQQTRAERHSRELPIMRRAVAAFSRLDIAEHETEIIWLESGKPVLTGTAFADRGISLSHNQGTVLCIAGDGPQGCDLETVTGRSRSQWLALCGSEREPLLDALCAGTDSLDRAGTRIWTALEAFFKADGLLPSAEELRIDSMADSAVLFKKGGAGRDAFVLTFQVVLTRGTERMAAVTVAKYVAQPLPAAQHSSRTLQYNISAQNIDNVWQLKANRGNDGRYVDIVHIFPLGFKGTQLIPDVGGL